MSDLIEMLESFNRKERYHLVKMVLGGFKASEEFRNLPEFKKFGIEIPEHHFAAMDYHLDWIYASLISCFKNIEDNTPVKKDERIRASQEDIDFLIAYKDPQGRYHLVFLEAKGVTGWSNEQMKSKCLRLNDVFGNKADPWYGKVIPHLFITSPQKPVNLKIECDCYSSESWIQLDIPKELKKVERCNESGKKSKNGDHWKIENEYPFN